MHIRGHFWQLWFFSKLDDLVYSAKVWLRVRHISYNELDSSFESKPKDNLIFRNIYLEFVFDQVFLAALPFMTCVCVWVGQNRDKRDERPETRDKKQNKISILWIHLKGNPSKINTFYPFIKISKEKSVYIYFFTFLLFYRFFLVEKIMWSKSIVNNTSIHQFKQLHTLIANNFFTTIDIL